MTLSTSILIADIAFVLAVAAVVVGGLAWYFNGGADRLAERYRRRRSKL